MKKRRFRGMLKAINNYVVFFLTVAFAVSCCMMLFVSTLADSMGLVFNEENIGAAAKVTFLNVLLLTLLFGTIDYVRRKIMVERPVKFITEATERIMQGDFSVRVRPMHGAGMEGFNQIGMAINAMDICSPQLSSISRSLPGGVSVISLAFVINSSVVSPCADTTTAT